MSALRHLVLHLLAAIAAVGGILTAGAAEPTKPELPGGWHFVRTHNPSGGADAISIMRTADTSKSDLDFAGLMIRCRQDGTEVLVVFIRAFPLRAQPSVIFNQSGRETRFKAAVDPPGSAIRIPGDARSLVEDAWQSQGDLLVRVEDGQTTIRGVVPLDGLQAGFKMLLSNCAAL
jgi:hypothetical protein